MSTQIERLHEIVSSADQLEQVKPTAATPISAIGQGLSLRNHRQARAVRLNTALGRMVALAFERDDDGLYCNIGPDGKIIVPVPWGRRGREIWGLTVTEANTLRRMLLAWDKPEPLFYYDDMTRAWYLNRADYRTAGSAGYWAGGPITAIHWYKFSEVARGT